MHEPPELRHLRYFIAVAEELSFTRAAARLFMSSSPLSQRIKELERKLGVLLFERDHQGVQLTAAGRSLLPRAKELLFDAQEAVDAARAAGNYDQRTLRVGMVCEFGHGAIGAMLAAFADATLGVDVEVVPFGLDTPCGGVSIGAVDTSVVVTTFRAHDSRVSPLFFEQPVVVAATTRFEGKTQLTRNDMARIKGSVARPPTEDDVHLDFWTGNGSLTGTGAPYLPLDAVEYAEGVIHGDLAGMTMASAAAAIGASQIAFTPVADMPSVTVGLCAPVRTPKPEVTALERFIRNDAGPVLRKHLDARTSHVVV